MTNHQYPEPTQSQGHTAIQGHRCSCSNIPCLHILLAFNRPNKIPLPCLHIMFAAFLFCLQLKITQQINRANTNPSHSAVNTCTCVMKAATWYTFDTYMHCSSYPASNWMAGKDRCQSIHPHVHHTQQTPKSLIINSVLKAAFTSSPTSIWVHYHYNDPPIFQRQG
jgi:hypothetical protein